MEDEMNKRWVCPECDGDSTHEFGFCDACRKECPHENDVEYLGLVEEDGQPQYQVQCSDCGKEGIILLEEGENIWE